MQSISALREGGRQSVITQGGLRDELYYAGRGERWL